MPNHHNTALQKVEIQPSAVNVLENELIYSYNFDEDVSKFLHGDTFKVQAHTKKWLILTNFHGTTELNTTNTYVPGTRTLSWANPLEYTRYLFTNLADSHNYSALLLDWNIKPGVKASEHANYREEVTFIFIPPKKEITFLIGFAAPQSERDERAGGGVQLRLKNLPADTVTVQTHMQLKPSKSMNIAKGEKVFDFEATYDSAMEILEHYLDSPEAKNISLPNSIFTPEHKIYSAASEFFDIEDLSPEEIKISSHLLKQFDVSKYIEDKFNNINKEDVNN